MLSNRQAALFSAVMLSSLVAVVSSAVRRFVPGWQPGYLVGASLLVALEATLIHATFRRERMWLSELLRYLVPELAVMAVLMRVATTLSLGTATLVDDVARWLYDPLSILDGPFVAAVLAGLVIGWLSHTSMHDLYVLAPRPSEPSAYSADDRRALVMLAEERAAALGRVGGRFIMGGGVLLGCLGLEAVNIEHIGGASRAISTLSAAGALSYLVSGFLLYSQARLALLRARWQSDGARVADDVPRRWIRTSWLIIGSVVCIAAVLPRTYGLGLLDTIRSVIAMSAYVLALLGYLLIWLFSMALLIPAWLLSLLNIRGRAPAPPALPPMESAPPPPPALTHEPRLGAALIFWVCMLLLAGYAIWIVGQRHPGLIRTLRGWGRLVSLLAWIRRLWEGTQTWAGQVAHLVQAQRARATRLQPSRRAWLRLSRLAPRELVRYFYRLTLRRAAQRGLPRRAGQTPYEYRTTLATRLPEAEGEFTELTEAFVTAQYSLQPIGRAEARRTRQVWERVRRHLRTLRAP